MKNNSMQRLVVNTLFQEMMDHHNQKDGFRETRKIGPVLEVTTSCLFGKHGIDIRSWSLRKDNSQSWVRISHGSSKFVIDSNNNDTESPADLPEEQASQQKVKDFAARSKAKAKPQRRELVDSPSIIPMNERKWIDIEPGNSSFSAYEISKKVIHLLRHWQTVQREEDRAVQFWRIKNYSQNQFPQTTYWSDDRWKICLAAGGGGAKRRYQYCTDISETIVYLRALQGHSGRNLIDPSLQDNVIIQSGFFQHFLPHWMCFLSSFYHQQWIDTWRSEFKQETDSILFACWSQRQRASRSCKDWLHCTTSCTILAQCMEETSRRGILGWYWSCDSKRIDILSDSIECNHPSRNCSSFLYSKSCQIEDWRSLKWEIIHVSSTTTKDLITSRLDQRESSIGFYRSSTCNVLPTNPTNPKTNLWSIRATW